ncbi:MAG TPA: CPBP family intramembrane glutamic endopeptidase [Candidatus Acidoferrales bacterium]|nr:CPBP family intramembrane glutamic endopeptidase [Candidatus Acidoferrales bacterium]
MAETEARRAKISIIVYLVLTFGFSSIFYRLIIHRGNQQAHGLLLVSCLMWSPGVAGLLTRLFMQGSLRGHGWGWGKWKYEFAGYWIPLAYAAVVYLPLWIAGYADFKAIPHNAFAQTAARLGLHSTASAPGYFLVLATYGAFMACTRALGEELGWRGFLVPQLAKVTSFRGVALISGVIWSLWHYPLILFANYNGAGPRWYSILCFTVMVIGISFLFAWMRLKSGSFWPCMLLHGSHNVFIQAFFDPLTRPAPLTNYMIGEFGAGLAIVAIILAIVFDRKRNELPQTREA